MQVAKRGFFKRERMFGLQICNMKRNEIINFKIGYDRSQFMIFKSVWKIVTDTDLHFCFWVVFSRMCVQREKEWASYISHYCSRCCHVLATNVSIMELRTHFGSWFRPINLTLSANPTKWSNTLKQFVGCYPTNCLSVYDHFVGLELEGLKKNIEAETLNFLVSKFF